MKIIWAIDPFESSVRPNEKAIEALKAWNDRAGAEVQPVFVLDVEEGAGGATRLKLESAKKAAVQIIRDRLKISWTKDPIALSARSPSVRESVERLLTWARLEGADLIAVSSHGRGGVSKAIFGSFAETLLRLSGVPVFFLSNHPDSAIPSPDLARILYASDFSKASRQGFVHVVGQAKKLGSRVILYHHLGPAPEALSLIGAAGMIPYSPLQDFERSAVESRIELDAWVKWAGQQGVQAEGFLDQVRGSTSERILMAAREGGAGMIALGTDSDAFKAFVPGSVAKHVFRDGGIPVWAVGPAFLMSHSESNSLDSKRATL
jgi:nucleotide-binding universal stress UspA family protein